MIKYFTTRYGRDPVAKIDELRKEFPKCHFLGGVHKDSKGIFVIKDLECKQYGEKWQLDNGDFFFSASDAKLEEIRNDISKYKTEYQERIKVALICGKELEIYPASALPRKVYFSKKIIKQDSPYDTTVDYGLAAYKLFDRTQKDDKLMLDDPQMIEFVKMALKYSYTIPEPLWDSLQLVSFGDFDKIFAAAMGMDWDYLQEELGKSNAQSAQMTGATAQ